MPELLFVYGTLHPDRAPAEIASVVGQLTGLGPATVRGRKVDLGEYPGLLLDEESETEVAGHLFQLPEMSETIWRQLDRYEDFRPANPAESLFLRERTTATPPDGRNLRCWVYVYNRQSL